MVFGTQLRSVPSRFGFDGWTRPAGCDFDGPRGDPGDGKRKEHREKNFHPGFASHGEGNRDSNRAGNHVGRPVPHPAHHSHHLSQFG